MSLSHVSALNHIRLAVHHHNGQAHPHITLDREDQAVILRTTLGRERFTLTGLTARGRGGAFDLTDRFHRVQLLATVLPTQVTTEDLGGVTPLMSARGFTVTVGRRTPWTSAFGVRPVHATHPDGRVVWLAEYTYAAPGGREYVTVHAGHATLAVFERGPGAGRTWRLRDRAADALAALQEPEAEDLVPDTDTLQSPTSEPGETVWFPERTRMITLRRDGAHA